LVVETGYEGSRWVGEGGRRGLVVLESFFGLSVVLVI